MATIRVKDANLESSLKKEEAENTIDLLKYERMDITGDQVNFALLTFLYFIQGAVTGLMMAVPFILQKRKSSFQDQVINVFLIFLLINLTRVFGNGKTNVGFLGYISSCHIFDLFQDILGSVPRQLALNR